MSEGQIEEIVGPDGFRYTTDHPFCAAHRLIDDHLREHMPAAATPGVDFSGLRTLSEASSSVDPFEIVRQMTQAIGNAQQDVAQRARALRSAALQSPLLRQPPEMLRQVALAMMDRADASCRRGHEERSKQPQFSNRLPPDDGSEDALRALFSAIAASELPLTDEDVSGLAQRLVAAVEAAARPRDERPIDLWVALGWKTKYVLKVIRRYARSHPLPEEARAQLIRFRQIGCFVEFDTDEWPEIIDEMLGWRPAGLPGGETWAEALRADLDGMSDETASRWRGLLAFAASASGSTPTKKWLARARELVEALGREEFEAGVVKWLPLVGAESPKSKADGLFNRNGDFLKGLVWAGSLTDAPAVARAVGRLGASVYKKIPNVGPRSAAVGNACIWMLGSRTDKEAAAQIAQIRRKVSYVQAQSLIEKALNAAAERSGMSREEFEEIAVPEYDMDGPGRWERDFGAARLTVSLGGSGAAEWSWSLADGTKLKSAPAEVREREKAALKELKATVEEAGGSARAQRERLERLMISDREIPLAAWRERYIEHPLVSLYAGRLIWLLTTGDKAELGALLEGVLVDSADRPLEVDEASTTVRVWHPLGWPEETVQAWRSWLDRHRLVQPFKQAHREIYALTDVEEATGTLTERFSGHILRQHQFHALCRDRGWTYRLQGDWDSWNNARIDLPDHGLRVELEIGSILETEQSRNTIYLWVETGELSLFRQSGAAVATAEIP